MPVCQCLPSSTSHPPPFGLSLCQYPFSALISSFVCPSAHSLHLPSTLFFIIHAVLCHPLAFHLSLSSLSSPFLSTPLFPLPFLLFSLSSPPNPHMHSLSPSSSPFFPSRLSFSLLPLALLLLSHGYKWTQMSELFTGGAG